jgi:hypothetical protein
MIDLSKVKIKAGIGNILTGTGIPSQFAGHYVHTQAINNSRKRGSFHAKGYFKQRH